MEPVELNDKLLYMKTLLLLFVNIDFLLPGLLLILFLFVYSSGNKHEYHTCEE